MTDPIGEARQRLAADARERLDKLTDQARDLSSAVTSLNTSTKQLGRRTTRSEVVLVITIVSFILDIILTTVLTIGLIKQRDATMQIQQVQSNGAVIREEVLCPLYQLLVSSYSVQARARYPGGPAAYDHAFVILRGGAHALNCPHS